MDLDGVAALFEHARILDTEGNVLRTYGGPDGDALDLRADSILRNLRTPGESSYKIPRGGLYERISCPNYLGEILEWLGWALATWSLAGLAFAVYTIANLGPRAISHHRWYQREFDDYPGDRKALIPYLL